jgi:hypothetical protein
MLRRRLAAARTATLRWLDAVQMPEAPRGVTCISQAHDPVAWPGVLLPGTYNGLLCRNLIAGLDDWNAIERRALLVWLEGFRLSDGHGLVDELGNFDAAVAKAAELGGISGEPRLVEYEHLPSFQSLLSGFSGRLQHTQADEVLEAIEEFTLPAIEYRYVGPRSE